MSIRLKRYGSCFILCVCHYGEKFHKNNKKNIIIKFFCLYLPPQKWGSDVKSLIINNLNIYNYVLDT